MPLMRTDQQRINVRRAAIIFVAGIIAASCSHKSAPDREKDVNSAEASSELVRESKVETDEVRPGEDQIEEDCAAFVRSTKVVSTRGAATNCPSCPGGATAILTFRGMKTEAVSCSGDTCSVVVTIRAVFNPGSGETVTGGLTAWISLEQRNAYLNGHAPSGEQAYRVRITYKRRGPEWRVVEFDRAPV